MSRSRTPTDPVSRFNCRANSINVRALFGIPLFRKRFPYSQMTAVETSRSNIIDGWGIHYMPGRGWIYNLWGFDCVKVTMGKRTVRIGTNDVEGLVGFLRTKIGVRE